MSCLSVYHITTPELPNKMLSHGEDIRATLAAVGVQFMRWPALEGLSLASGDEQVLQAYHGPVQALQAEHGYQAPQCLRGEKQGYREEVPVPPQHQRGASAAFCLVAGQLQISFQVEDYVYVVLCEKHDVVVLPAQTPYWIDPGLQPQYLCLAFSCAGDREQTLESDLAGRFPRLEY